MRWHRPGERLASGLVELFVVLGVIGVLLAMVFPAIQRVREAANRTVCQSNMRQIALALHQQHDDRAARSLLGIGWLVTLLPYVEQGTLWTQTQQALLTEPIATYLNPPHAGAARVLPLYTCPTDSRLRGAHVDPDGYPTAFTSYLGVRGGAWGQNQAGFFTHNPLSFAAIQDGLSNTLLMGERPPPDTFLAGRWYSATYDNGWTYLCWRGPDHTMNTYYSAMVYIRASCAGDCSGPFRYGRGRTDNPCDRWHFWSLHPGGANFAFGDGSVRFLSYSAEPIMIALATCNGGEVVSVADYD